MPKQEFKVSTGEMKYLQQLILCNESLGALLASHEDAPGRSVTFRLSRPQSEQLSDSFSTQLMAVGFGKNYARNEEGQMLEELIDRFYVP